MPGVKGLAAMFEQKGDSGTPDRGRSPAPGGLSVGSPSPSDSPRPLSKVRTSFVTVEKGGRIGLKREPSGDSVSASSRRMSNETGATTPQPASDKSDVFADSLAKSASPYKANLSQAPIPESPVIDVAPNANPDKQTDEEEVKTKMLPGDPTSKEDVEGRGVASKSAAKPTTAGAKPGSKTSTAAVKKTAAATKKPSPVDLPASSGNGFVKPKPKSPTRPVKLPSSLATHTASSASRTGTSASSAPRQSLSRATNAASETSSGTANRSRPSLGVPKQNGKESSASKKDAPVDEGFLARMMRPTQASSSKTADKAGVTSPPRKPSAPATNAVPAPKRVVPKPREPAAAARKVAPKAPAASKPKETAAKTTPKSSTSGPAPKKVAPATRSVPSAKAAPSATQAKIPQKTTDKPSEKTEAKSIPQETTAKDVAPVVAQEESAEAIIEAAKASKETATTPLVERAELEKPEHSEITEPSAVETDGSQPAEKLEPESHEQVTTLVQDEGQHNEEPEHATEEDQKAESDQAEESAHDSQSGQAEEPEQPEPLQEPTQAEEAEEGAETGSVHDVEQAQTKEVGEEPMSPMPSASDEDEAMSPIAAYSARAEAMSPIPAISGHADDVDDIEDVVKDEAAAGEQVEQEVVDFAPEPVPSAEDLKTPTEEVEEPTFEVHDEVPKNNVSEATDDEADKHEVMSEVGSELGNEEKQAEVHVKDKEEA